MRVSIRFIFLLAAIPTFLHAQNSVLQGKVIDATSKEPVPFATVKLREHMMGVVTNSDGDFQIPTSYRSIDDAIVISCIGYVTRTISFESFQAGQVNQFELTPSATMLKDVIVRARDHKRTRKGKLSPERIVANAIQNIPANYPTTPYAYIGYYRDYQLRDTSYLNLNEAIVEVYDRGFRTNDQLDTQMRLYEFKENLAFPRDTIASAPYDNKPSKVGNSRNKYIPNAVISSLGGNELSILRLHDAIRNNDVFSYSFVNTFSKDFIFNHVLKQDDDVYLDTVSLYVISFESRFQQYAPRNYSKGKIYIEKGNFAIHKLEYETYDKTMRTTNLMYQIVVEYSKLGGKMYLNYISFNNGFRLNNDVGFKVIEIKYSPLYSGFVLDFNQDPEITSVSDTSNYHFTLNGRPIKITRAEVVSPKRVVLRVDEGTKAALRDEARVQSSNLKFLVDNIRDKNNRLLDAIDNRSLYQFRELFVQKILPEEQPAPGAMAMRKDLPLSKNPATPASTALPYWMNTPLKKNSAVAR